MKTDSSTSTLPIYVKKDYSMLLGSGYMGEVFAINEDVVAKIFYHNVPQDIVQYEVDMTKCAKSSPVNVVSAGNVFEYGGRFGAYFQRVYGVSVFDACLKQPWKLFSYAKVFANTHRAFHTTKITYGRQQKEELATKIKSVDTLSEREKGIVLERLEGLEGGSNLCHGDFHLNNIIIDGDEWVVIDWGGAMCGNPIADAAHTAMLLKLGELPRDASLGARVCAAVFRKLFSQLYLYYYFEGQKEKLLEYKKWQLPLAVARLASNNVPELNKLKKTIEKELKKQG